MISAEQRSELPVRGGAGVEDVLFGREQRQAVGIKVDRPRTHDGKSFPTTPAACLSAGPDASAAAAAELCRFMRCRLKDPSLCVYVSVCLCVCRSCALPAWRSLRLHTGLCAAGQKKFAL